MGFSDGFITLCQDRHKVLTWRTPGSRKIQASAESCGRWRRLHTKNLKNILCIYRKFMSLYTIYIYIWCYCMQIYVNIFRFTSHQFLSFDYSSFQALSTKNTSFLFTNSSRLSSHIFYTAWKVDGAFLPVVLVYHSPLQIATFLGVARHLPFTMV